MRDSGSAGVGQHEVVELDLFGNFSGGGEEAEEEVSEVLGLDAVEVVLSFTT